jgi:ubiquinol oxidase
MSMPKTPPLARHHSPKDFSDRVAYGFTRFLRFLADTFFARRYGHRAVVLETVATVPGMVGGTLLEAEAIHSYTEYLAGAAATPDSLRTIW